MSPFSRAAAATATAAKDAATIGKPVSDLPPVRGTSHHGKEAEGSTGLRRAPVISVCCFFLLIITAGLVMVFSVNRVLLSMDIHLDSA